ncbi:hypothetical protein [Streptomyces sp. NPDC048516]|uniref:hypothetical protein n=1 Tax=Streptomyces sp. NPDC048516 TaxID=3365565 RepID=UPI00371D96D2
MGTFLAAAAGFPTIVFTAALVVVVAFWLLVAVGVTESGSFDADADFRPWGMGGVPVTVAFSLLTALAWFVSLAGTVLLDSTASPGLVRELLRPAVLVVAMVVAWRVTRVLVRPLHRLFPAAPGPPRADFIGLTCIIRTGRVDAGFGRAEAAAHDGSTTVIQVRQPGDEPLTYGSTGLLYAYDEAGGFFWVEPCDAALDPGGHAT